MIVVLSDTHRRERPGLSGPLGEAVKTAELVIHAGDFTTEAVLDGFQSLTDSFIAVAGNRDMPGVSDRLPRTRTVDIGSVTAALTHTQTGGRTGLSYFGEERDAQLVISGHTHTPHVVTGEGPILLNPGSHADPRGGPATYATLTLSDGGIEGRIHALSGDEKRSFRVEGRSTTGDGS